MKDIPLTMSTSAQLRWETCGGNEAVFTSDGTRFAIITEGMLGNWWKVSETGSPLRPLGMTWEAAEALVASPQPPSPQSAQQPKAEEPFRPGLPPAELRAVCKEWEWSAEGMVEPADFVGDEHRFLNNPNGDRKSPIDLAASFTWRVGSQDFFRPLGRTWADVEAKAAAAAAKAAAKATQLPKDGDIITVASAVAIVKEGCRQALDEAATRRQPGKVGNYSHVTYVNPWPPRTFIIASPPGRRKYVKLLLKRLGYRNVDKIPTTDKQTPFDLGRSLPDHERENLLAIAPGIVLRDTL
jgi:hypothetical protein